MVASFNDWFPMRMKTLRAIRLEKYEVDDEDIPRDIFMLDNKISMYANMVPPGMHYFYLCFEKGDMFLSPNHEVVRFKTTNAYLNRIQVKPRLQDNLDTVFQAKGIAEEEAAFMKDRSVFAPYEEDNE